MMAAAAARHQVSFMGTNGIVEAGVVFSKLVAQLQAPELLSCRKLRGQVRLADCQMLIISGHVSPCYSRAEVGMRSSSN